MVEYKEIKWNPKQKGYGLAVTNPSTGIRALVGIFKTKSEAAKEGRYRLFVLQTVINPRVVKWNRQNYNRYDYIFKK